jgi:hypothetical protein
MDIDYKNSRLVMKTVDFDGTTDDGKGFTITANWNDWDGWAVDDISWDDEEGTDEQIEEIKEEFLNTAN